MYPITIKREPQEVRYEKEIELKDGQLTLAELRKFVSEDETFSINEVETDRIFGYVTMLYINGKRLETPEETKVRVEKEETYMKNYNEYHLSKKTK